MVSALAAVFVRVRHHAEYSSKARYSVAMENGVKSVSRSK